MNPKKYFTVIFLLLLAPLTQADFLDATDAYKAKDYSKAFKEFSKLARLGNKRAQFNLGVMYLNGEGVEMNLPLAYAWGKLSEQQARPEFSQIAKKVLTVVDEKEHEKLELKAKQFEFEFGQTAIHTKLSPIEYIPTESNQKNNRPNVVPIQRTAPRYPKASLATRKQGWATGIMDVHPDGSVRAVEIVQSFPDNSFDQATVDALSTFKFKVTFPKGSQPSVMQVKQTIFYELKLQANEKRIQKIYKDKLSKIKELASVGHPEAQYTYAVAARSNLFQKAENIEQKEANEWLLKAAQNGHIDAQYLLGKNILQGKGCKIEKQKAINWIVTAAEQGHDKSAREVHRLLTQYKNLNHTNRSPESWLKQSAESGNPESKLEYAKFIVKRNNPTSKQLELAESFLNSFSNNRKKNVAWYQTAAYIEIAKGNDKKASKYQKKALKLAEKLGWKLDLASI